jgi:hypothetical protein
MRNSLVFDCDPTYICLNTDLKAGRTKSANHAQSMYWSHHNTIWLWLSLGGQIVRLKSQAIGGGTGQMATNRVFVWYNLLQRNWPRNLQSLVTLHLPNSDILKIFLSNSYHSKHDHLHPIQYWSHPMQYWIAINVLVQLLLLWVECISNLPLWEYVYTHQYNEHNHVILYNLLVLSAYNLKHQNLMCISKSSFTA